MPPRMSLMVPFIIPLYGSVTAFPSLDRYSARPPACFPIAIPEDIPKNKQRKRTEKKKRRRESNRKKRGVKDEEVQAKMEQKK